MWGQAGAEPRVTMQGRAPAPGAVPQHRGLGATERPNQRRVGPAERAAQYINIFNE